MGETVYPVEVQTDFIAKITRAKPVQALAELIWNSLDADANSVTVTFGYDELDSLSSIAVSDNGRGLSHKNAPAFFGRLGGSWKKPGMRTEGGRFLHGQEGRGRFKAFALGRLAEWNVTYQRDSEFLNFAISIDENNFREVHVTDEEPASVRRSGVTITIRELHKDFRSLTSEQGLQELTESFALYLSDYTNVSIVVDGHRLDPAPLIASRQILPLEVQSIVELGHAASIEVIEWRNGASRSVYLCTEDGFPLLKVDRRFQIGDFHFSAYIKCGHVSSLQKNGILELAEMDPATNVLIDAAQDAIKGYFRNRAAEGARSRVAEWKSEHIYPYEGEAVTQVQKVERQVFDIVAVNVAQFVPDFDGAPQKNKALHLRLLRHAIEKSPEDLQLILEQVLNLPKRKQQELAGLLKDVSLSAIIGAASIVAGRLKFLLGLEAILFDSDPKRRLKERSQLHRIIALNCWVFGEEYSLSVDDQSLTEVLRKHRKLLGDDVRIDEPVKHISKKTGIIDLMLSRAVRRHRSTEFEHLVVELKAPKVVIGQKQIGQIEEYAFSVAKDERFRALGVKWQFWIISDDHNEYAEERMDNEGRIHRKGNIEIFVKTWSQVISDNRSRMQFFQERLEFSADKESSLAHLQEHYASLLEGVLIDPEEAEAVRLESTEEE